MNLPMRVLKKINTLNPITSGGSTIGRSRMVSRTNNPGKRCLDRTYPDGIATRTDKAVLIIEENIESLIAYRIAGSFTTCIKDSLFITIKTHDRRPQMITRYNTRGIERI